MKKFDFELSIVRSKRQKTATMAVGVAQRYWLRPEVMPLDWMIDGKKIEIIQNGWGRRYFIHQERVMILNYSVLTF